MGGFCMQCRTLVSVLSAQLDILALMQVDCYADKDITVYDIFFTLVYSFEYFVLYGYSSEVLYTERPANQNYTSKYSHNDGITG